MDAVVFLSPLLFALGAFFTGLGVILLRNSYPAGARALGLAMLGVAVWVGGAAVEPLVASLPDAFAVARSVKYVGVCFVPVLFFIFVARYALDTALPAWVILLVITVPAVSLGLVFTNPIHELMWAHPPVVPGTGAMRSPWGWWFLHVYTPTQYGLAMAALIVLLMEIVRASTLRRAQSIVLFLGASIPLGVNMAYVLDPTLPDLQQTPLSFAFSAIVFGWGFFHFRLFQVNPLALRAVFDAVGDAVVLVDREGRVADVNPAARHLLVAPGTGSSVLLIGVPLATVCAKIGLEPMALEDGTRAELATGDGRHLETVIRAVRERGGDEVRGHVLVIRDMTERRIFERRLAESEATLREVVTRAPMGILRLTPVGEGGLPLDFRCVLANPGAHQLLRAREGTLEGRSLREVDPPHAHRILQLFRQVLEHGGTEEVVLEVTAFDDDPRWFQLSASALGTDVSVTFVDITRERERQNAMAREAHHDALTGLLNRRGLEVRAAHILEKAKRDGTQVGVLFMDLDRFKEVNDRHGHERGDELLKAFAGRLRGSVRSGDLVARFGGDEFVAVLRLKDLAKLREAADRIRGAAQRPYRFESGEDGGTFAVVPSVGMARLGPDGDTLEELLRVADAAMYRVKSTSRGG